MLGCLIACLFLIKETGMILVASFAALAIVRNWKHSKRLWVSLTTICVPALLALSGWSYLVSLHNGHGWNSDVPGKSAYSVLLRSMLGGEDGRFLPLRQNLENAVVLNWQWVHLVASICLSLYLLKNRQFRSKLATCAPVLLTGALYIGSVFNFPTWTVPRYALPVTLSLSLIVALGAVALPLQARVPVLASLVTLNLIAVHTSTDPLSRFIWGTFDQRGETVYNTDMFKRGPDRVMYNLQLAKMSKVQNAILQDAFARTNLLVTDCNDLKISEKIWTIQLHKFAYPQFSFFHNLQCMHPHQLSFQYRPSNDAR